MVDPNAKFKAYGQSPYIVQSQMQIETFNTDWKTKDESENFCQRHDQEIVKLEKRLEVEADIKDDVFDILADELRNLKLAVEKVQKKSKKGAKGAKGKGKAGKSKKKGKKVRNSILLNRIKNLRRKERKRRI